MTEVQISKVKVLTARKELLERLKEGFLDGSAFAPGVKATLGSNAFSSISALGIEVVDKSITNIKSELEAL
jgi:hypothetical protein